MTHRSRTLTHLGRVFHSQRLDHSLSLYGSALVLIVVGCVLAGVGAFVIRDTRTADVQVQRMYAGSVLGLRRIGELQYQAQETRRSTLYALTTSNSNLQIEYADQSRDADQRVSEGIAAYLKDASTPAQFEAGHRLQEDWSAYLKVRDEVLGSILEGSTAEAVSFDLKGGVPSFDHVREDLDNVKRLYDDQAFQQLATVGAISRRSVVRLIAVLSLTVIFASVCLWAVHRSRMLAALELAKLQMDFVASMSHELRTPLSVIRSAAENIADGVIDDDEQMTRYGLMIRNQTRQITGMVNELLLFASTEQSNKGNRHPYSLQALQVSTVVATVVENTAELIYEEGFSVEQLIQSGLPDVSADLAGLSQCLQNLVVNAVKYSGDSRWIAIRAFLHNEAGAKPEVHISVQDRGIGIAPTELRRVFEPFYRSAAAAAAQIHGTGLGLPLAKRIIEAMGGTLSATSKLGEGSTFTLRLRALSDTSKVESQECSPITVRLR